jgi:hypothetical protein
LHRTTAPTIEVDQSVEHLLGPFGLTQQATTFDRRAVLRGWCEQLACGAAISTIEQLADRVVDDSRVVALKARDPYSRYSTTALIALERRLVDQAVSPGDVAFAVVEERDLRAALDARPELSPEQVVAVAAMTTSGNGVDVIVAAAGTGKTFCLDAAHDAWRRAGYRVIGATLAATAARQLQAQTAIASDTIALRNIQLAEGDLELDTRTVVVIDEATMASTRGLAPLVDAAHRAGSKVVLVGDPHQLDAIDAGGLLHGLARRLTPVTLLENRRQSYEWERQALQELRTGNVERALSAYENHDRVTVAKTAIDVRNQMAADWFAATLAGDRVVMIAAWRFDVGDLNQRARRHLSDTGALAGPSLSTGDVTLQAGDRVLCLRNARRLGVQNGTVATITRIDVHTRSLDLRVDDGTALHLPSRYIDAGHVTYGYARTIHKSQGMTVDRCLVLASDTLDHQAGYTALSRGRTDNRIYLVERELDPEAHHHERQPLDARHELARALGTDRGEHLAIDHDVDALALRDQLADLYRQRQQRVHIRDTIPPDRSADITALERELQSILARYERARCDLDDAIAKRPRVRRRREHASELLANERAYQNASSAMQRVSAALDYARVEQRWYEQYRRAHAGVLADLTAIDRRIEQRLDQLVDAVSAEPPNYLRALAAIPATVSGRDTWKRATRAIEAYRAEHNVTDTREPFGVIPRGATESAAWRHAVASLALDRASLTPPCRAHESRQRDQGVEIEL